MVKHPEKKPPKVFWKPDELDKVGLRATEILAAADASGKHLGWINAVMQAQQEVLTPDRCRPHSSLKSSTDVHGKLKELGRKLYHTKQEQLRQQAEREAEEQKRRDAEHEAEQQRRIAELHQTRHKQEVPTHQITPVVQQFRADDLVKGFVENIGEAFRASLTEKLNSVFHEVFNSVQGQMAAHMVTIIDAPPAKPKKEKVLILGINQDQFNGIRHDFEEYFSLDFVDNDKTNRLKAAAAAANHVIVNTSNISHTSMGRVRHHPGLKMTNGGGSQIKDVLLDLATR